VEAPRAFTTAAPSRPAASPQQAGAIAMQPLPAAAQQQQQQQQQQQRRERRPQPGASGQGTGPQFTLGGDDTL